MEKINVEKIFKKWCKDTKRNGGVLVGSSIREFLNVLQTEINTHSQQMKIPYVPPSERANF